IYISWQAVPGGEDTGKDMQRTEYWRDFGQRERCLRLFCLIGSVRSPIIGHLLQGGHMSQLAAIYARLSTDDKQQTSIPKQIDLCRAAASKHGIVVPENYIFVDDGYSGALLERPALNRLLELARSRSITAIFVSDADRLSREPGHDWMIREDLKR